MRALAVLFASTLLWAAEPVPAAAPVAAPAAAATASAAILPAADRLQAQALAFAQAECAARSGAYTFKVLKAPVLPRNDAGDMRFEPSHLSKREPGGHFFASFKASLDGRPLGMVRVDMEGKWVGKLLRTTVSLPRKAVPEADQVETSDFEGVPPAGALSAIPEGFRLRNPVAAGHVLVQSDLEGIPVVMAGDQVRLELSDGALTVSVEALARSQGAVGDRVRLEMPTTRKTVMAVVKGPGEARAQWSGTK